ncbi:hypothetical protein [Streptomyces sp. NPDC058371]|uniref:hypothetical protein n=1 Tax=Streptomyces sp. NPDC058371 TaxID=3346463 RepID=UPI00364AC936
MPEPVNWPEAAWTSSWPEAREAPGPDRETGSDTGVGRPVDTGGDTGTGRRIGIGTGTGRRIGIGTHRPAWEQPGEPGHTHDPNEVTVQLDGAGREVSRPAGAAPAGPERSDGPVFVDESGRRSRRYRRLGVIVGIACAVYAVVIVATLLSGNSSAPWLPVPGQQKDRPAGKVETSPLPADPARPPALGSLPGWVSPAPRGTTPRPPGADEAPHPSGSAKAPDTSADPKPPAGTGRPKPSTGTKDPGPDPEPSVPASEPPGPGPSAGGGGPSAEPSSQPPPAEAPGSGPGTTTVAAPDSGPTATAGPSSSYSENTL